MGKGSLPKLVIFGDPKKGPVSEVIEQFTDFVAGKAKVVAKCRMEEEPVSRKIAKWQPECPVDVLKGCDFAVVFGGDGTIISAARDLSRCNVPVIGVNLGKLGFLAEFSADELNDYFDDIISGQAHIEKRMILGCRVFNQGREEFNSTAINDVFITAGPAFRMIELSISVDGQQLAGCVSDGLVVSTPTGSTAYNLSAGGPILSGKMEAMVITPICPHSLSFRSIVINADSKIEVVGVRVNEGTTVSIDGQVSRKLSSEDVVRVEREKSDFLVVNNPLRTQWDALAAKLSWAKKPRYRGV